ncbi:hypothetical protein STEG23_031335 [Scotinomys teguina]
MELENIILSELEIGNNLDVPQQKKMDKENVIHLHNGVCVKNKIMKFADQSPCERHMCPILKFIVIIIDHRIPLDPIDYT